MRPSVLITGFGAFPGVDDNLSAQLAADVAKLAADTFPNVTITSATLATEWLAAPLHMAALVAKSTPDIILHFGVARDADHLRLETCARNTCRITEDACGSHPASACVDEAGAGALSVTVPVEHICARLNARGFNASLSDDAGAYLCNAVLYQSLNAAAKAGRATRIGFIHVPVTFKDPGFTRGQALRAGVEIVAACLDSLAG